MQSDVFDLTVIGGGITGAGIALDAASRGLKVALVEKRDFASGTSSRSSKLIHGGLRYLEQFEFSLVREALHERATLTHIAPHLAQPLQFLVPLYEKNHTSPLGSNKLKLKLGLWLYDLLAGRKNIGKHRWVDKEEALAICPQLDPQGLRGAFLYYDCLTDDSRLVIEVIKAAAAHGAFIASYTAVRKLEKSGNRISGVEVEDLIARERFFIKSRVVVNATGVWGDEISHLDNSNSRNKIRPSKGIHIVVPSERLAVTTATLIPSLGEQRFLFVIPWLGRTVIGTTDTDYKGELDDPAIEESEIARVLESAAQAFPAASLTREDVISSFAGLRPLISKDSGNTKDLSRKEQIVESPSGLISITGGKLTTYRHMAERMVDTVVSRLRVASPPPCVTKNIQLAGGALLLQDSNQVRQLAEEYEVRDEIIEHLMKSYGSNYRAILDIVGESEEMKFPLVEELPHIEAEVVYSARAEMVATVEDFLARRTRIRLLAADNGKSCEERVASLMGREMGWSSTEVESAMVGFGIKSQ
jgi:glycerol-3-phosphate dehydrogenase